MLMDRIIYNYACIPDDDLVICPIEGVAYQKDMTITAKYDSEYFKKFDHYAEKPERLDAINTARCEFVNKHIGDFDLIDVGCGSGSFLLQRNMQTWKPSTYGFDVNSDPLVDLKELGLFIDDISSFKNRSFWDVIEHLEEPARYFLDMPIGGYVFVSIPIFKALWKVRESRHYRPGEHLYYFTERGFIGWMLSNGFELKERSDFETRLGRNEILTYAFVKIKDE